MDQEQLKKLANLARIQVDDAVLADAAASITDVLALVDQLQAVDTGGVKPMSHPLDAEARLRNDEVSETDIRERCQASAPATEAGLYLVPKVID